uniref:Coagulation factor VIII, procoagulant component n=1 Tax=Cyprinus carpio TaxID=7962 RepID=A0A8C2FKZ4_CYPCA
MKVVLFLLSFTVCLKSSCVLAKTLEFFIAAVETKWEYVFTDTADPTANQRKFASGVQRYIKAVYTEYTDSTFTTPKSKPPWAGIQGPTIRTVVNDRVVVHFKNFASQFFSISPIGIPYWKQSEGAGYDDYSSVLERADDAVPPGGYYKYVWDISPNSGPTTSDPDCLTYIYSSQVDIVRDFNSGLIGTLLICKTGALTEERQRKAPEFILLLAVFDESKSWYREVGRADKLKKTSSPTQYHTINGYINSTLPGLTVCQKSPVVSWHLIGLGSTPEIHSIQFEGHTLKVFDHKRVTVEMTPMTFTMALMKPSATGKFLISCKIHSHQTAGMNAFFTVDNCPEPMVAPIPDKRNVIHAGNEDEEDEDNMFSIVFKQGGPVSVLRSSAKGRPKVWVHYIAAEEKNWDYSPSSSSAAESEWFRKGPQHLGGIYKKVAFVEYTDKTFTVKKTTGKILVGPELRGEVGDTFQICFKNMASRPFNIYPNGLTSILPLKNVDLRSLAVPPGEIMTYLWKLTADDGPTEADPRCLTRLYQSMVDPVRDVASGLVGPLIICKSQSLDKKGRVVTSDKEKKLLFTVFDENRSWYFEENVKKNSEDPTKIDRKDPDFYNSNVMHSGSVNGFMFNHLQFRLCVGDVILWHVASIGIQNNFLSVYFTGNMFERDKAYGTVLTLFPMSGDTVTTEVEMLGKRWRSRYWLEGMVTQNVVWGGYDKARNRRELWSVTKDKINKVDAKVLSNNEVLEESGSSGPKQDKMEESLNLHSYYYKDPKKFQPNLEMVLEPMSNSSDNQNYGRKSLASDYDDYDDEGSVLGSDHHVENNVGIRSTESRFRSYYIAAEEIMWDYGINKPSQLMRRGMKKYFPAYKKVVFRAYHDRDFKHPIKRGEMDEHLGIMGPVLKAESNDVLTVVFKNLASRPYSFHLHGVYDKTQGSFIPGMVPPGEERVYNWRVSRRQGPSASEFDCKAGAYYSNVNMEKDINSGLIGPMLICRPGTLRPRVLLQPDVTDFFLLFTTFDERKSWYLDYNIRKFCTPPCQAKVDDPWFEMSNKFAAINGYVSETLPGLIVEQYQMARWHLFNVGSQGEFHAVHFHGLPFGVRKYEEHRMGVFNLYPGVFGTVEMRPAIVGTWLIECTIGEHQMAGMRAKLIVYNPRCIQPLGMQSGWIDNKQITASDHYGNWKPSLARLELSGSINAWMGTGTNSWLQVDLLRPMLLHGIQTQGAKTSMGLNEYFTILYTISYSIDQENWTTYQGNSTKSSYTFSGNMDGSRIKENLFSPPIVGRYIRIHPLTFQKQPTLRIELLGCDLNSCSVPLGMERRLIPSSSISASSFLNKWLLSWSPDLARLHQKGRANAWRPKTNNPHEWLQVDFLSIKRVTGVVTQGARSVLKPMTVTEFIISISSDGRRWTSVKEHGTDSEKIFEGNSEHDEEVLNVFDPPLFTRFIRIHPKGWVNSIALRLEFLGCDTQQTL